MLPVRVCEVGRSRLGVDAVGITLVADPQARALIATSGPYSPALEAAQFELGEGPCLDVLATGEPALEPDLRTSGMRRWPLFSSRALELGVAAVFAFPLLAGDTRFGVLDADRTTPGPLSDLELTHASRLAQLASIAVLLSQAATIGPDEVLADVPSERIVVHQATGMVAAQAEIPVADALAWMRAMAFSSGRSLDSIASDLVARRGVLGAR
jgi:GAF domain-containing protein